MQLLLTLSALAVTAAVSSSFLYFSLRLLENRFSISVQIISLSVVAFFSWHINKYQSSLYFVQYPSFVYLIIIFTALLGSVFHRNSCVNPKSVFSSFILMMSVSSLSVLCFDYFFSLNLFNSAVCFRNYRMMLNSHNVVNAWSIPGVTILTTAQAILAPFFISVWKSRHLRPGLDVPISSDIES